MIKQKTSSIPTYLRVLNSCLSGRSRKIFPNQVVFYNAVFGVTNFQKFPDVLLEVMNRVSRGNRREEDETLIKQIYFFLYNGLDSNSANVGKHINNSREMPIPKQHRAHFLDEKNRSNIVRRLQIVIRFCLFCCQQEQCADWPGLQNLFSQMKRKFPGGYWRQAPH